MVKRAFSFLGIVAISALAGGVAAWSVTSINKNNSAIEITDSVSYSSEAPGASLGTQFTAFQAEQYPDLTYAAENAVRAVVNIEAVQEVEMLKKFRLINKAEFRNYDAIKDIGFTFRNFDQLMSFYLDNSDLRLKSYDFYRTLV